MAPRAFYVAAALLATLAVLLGPAAGQEPVVAGITGPSALAPGQVSAYNLTVVFGPPGNVNYTVHWYVTGADVSGALPAQSNPSSTSANRTAFKLNITAPPRDQDMTLVVKVSAKVGAGYENTSVEKAITVITPIILGATFRNDASTAAVNVTVRFYVDAALVGSQKIARIDAHGQATPSFRYLPVGLQPGAHTVRIEADLDGNGIIDPSRGEVALSTLFYRSNPPLNPGYTALIGIAVFLPVLLVTVAVRRRPRP